MDGNSISFLFSLNEKCRVEQELARISRRILDTLSSMLFVLESDFYLERVELIATL